MKIGKIFDTLIIEAMQAQTIIAYHGTPNKINRFSDEFVGGKDASDQEGPGIYFTTSYDDAAMYADNNGYIYTVKLTPKILYDESSDKKISEKLLLKLAMMAPEWEDSAQNFSEDPRTGVNIMINDAFEYNDNKKDVLLQLWIEFYRDSPLEFIRNCVKLGIDGIIVDRVGDIKHIIIYNLGVIGVEKVEQLQ